MVVVEVGVDLNDEVVVVVADGDLNEEDVEEVVVVDADVVLVVDVALHQAGSNNDRDDIPHSLKMLFIAALRERHTTHGW